MTNKQKFETLCGTITAPVSSKQKQYPILRKLSCSIDAYNGKANAFLYNCTCPSWWDPNCMCFCFVVVVINIGIIFTLTLSTVIAVGVIVVVAESNNYSVCSRPVSHRFLFFFYLDLIKVYGGKHGLVGQFSQPGHMASWWWLVTPLKQWQTFRIQSAHARFACSLFPTLRRRLLYDYGLS